MAASVFGSAANAPGFGFESRSAGGAAGGVASLNGTSFDSSIGGRLSSGSVLDAVAFGAGSRVGISD